MLARPELHVSIWRGTVCAVAPQVLLLTTAGAMGEVAGGAEWECAPPKPHQLPGTAACVHARRPPALSARCCSWAMPAALHRVSSRNVSEARAHARP